MRRVPVGIGMRTSMSIRLSMKEIPDGQRPLRRSSSFCADGIFVGLARFLPNAQVPALEPHAERASRLMSGLCYITGWGTTRFDILGARVRRHDGALHAYSVHVASRAILSLYSKM